MVDINYLKSLMKLFDGSTATELRIEEEGTTIKLSKIREATNLPQMAVQYAPAPAAPAPVAPAATSSPAAATPAPAEPAPAATPANYHEVLSPIVGMFYRSPSPDAPAFVEVGQAVSPGQVMCIVEAMKLMNEIECDTYGKVVKVLVENGQPVEYNQALFLIERES